MATKSFPSIADIHPVIRILCLLIVSVFIVSAKPVYLLATLFLLMLGFSMGAWTQLSQCGRVLLRLKWLFLSIFFIYIFLTPGQDVFPIKFLSSFSLGSVVNSLFIDVITIEGLYLGALRVFSLVTLILAVNLFVQAKQHTELSYAIIWLLSPLKYVGFPVDRLAIRISLTFKYVSEFQQILTSKKTPEKDVLDNQQANVQYQAISKRFSFYSSLSRRKKFFRNSITQAIDKSVILVERVLSRVNEAKVEPINRPVELMPRLHQWLLPISLLGLYLSLSE